MAVVLLCMYICLWSAQYLKACIHGLGFDPQWLPRLFLSVCFYADLPPVAVLTTSSIHYS